MSLSRRRFLQAGLSSLAYFTLESTTPTWIARSAMAMDASSSCLKDDRILVLIQMAGGNDGLNTIIPVNDPAYYLARPNIAIPKSAAITMDSLNRMHPAMQPLASWYQKGMMATIQNVGYVNPNLSHFHSMEYMEGGTVPGEERTVKGWAGRLYDSACGCNMPDTSLFYMAAGVGGLRHTTYGAECYTAPSVPVPEEYRLNAHRDEEARLKAITDLNRVPTLDEEFDFIQRSENLMEASIADVATATSRGTLVNAADYSEDSLGQGLKLASQVIRSGFKTRIFYVHQGGYDTHANQVLSVNPLEMGTHPYLLNNFAKSLNAFLREMERSGNLDRVLVMTFSEFGRRVEENGSLGTDHGAANNMMLFGGKVAGGVYGGQPNLLDLQRGNLKHQIDFRAVYAYAIQQWLRCNPREVFNPAHYDTIIQPDMAKIPYLKQVTSAAPSLWNAYN